ncbi:myotubularin-related protein 13-like [Diaphorina citri]|uniref:Myotubularin-related protein 13-like n=1 Tax=Diaphorina citri TaxID=121845 RepID=A0A3Q0J2C0_DIACI|nr:myotubularin-related protein 13-like [Diaphorina citri]
MVYLLVPLDVGGAKTHHRPDKRHPVPDDERLSNTCEQVVTRAFPITSLNKEKKITSQYLSHLDQSLQEGYQLRSSTFQLIKVAFDEEVSPDSIECFRRLIHKIRHPSHILHHFAFCGQQMVPQIPLNETKGKNASLKGYAKKAIAKTARKAGFKQKASSKRQKYILNSPAVTSNMSKYMTSPGRMVAPFTENDDEISMDNFEVSHPLYRTEESLYFSHILAYSILFYSTFDWMEDFN